MAGKPRAIPSVPTEGTPYLKEAILLALAAVIVGGAAGYLAVIVRALIALVTNVPFHGRVSFDFVTPAESSSPLRVLLVPAIGGLVATGIVWLFARETRVKGASDVVESLALKSGKLSARALTGHALATTVSVGSGGSAGREGAIVQLGAAGAVLLSSAIGLSTRHRKTLIACGAAGGIAGTFNTPIAGIVFAIEAVLFEFSTRSFVPLSISSVAGTVVATLFLGSEPSFPVPPYEIVTTWEYAAYAALGVLAGLACVLLLRALGLFDRIFRRLAIPFYARPLVGGVLVGALGLAVPQVLGVGYEHVEAALYGRLAVATLLLALLGKLVAFAVTRSSGGASGAFSPALFMGAMLGGLFGTFVHDAFPLGTATAGAYALVGMAAVYAGVTRASLTAIVMLFELTHNFAIILPLILTVAIADALAKAYGRSTIYSLKERERGRAFSHDLAVNILDRVFVGDIMSRELETIPQKAPVREVVARRFRTGHRGYPVVDESGLLVGIVTATDLREKVQDRDLDRPVSDFMTGGNDLATITPLATAHDALTVMVQHDIGHLPVVEAEDSRKLLGFLTRTDVVNVERRVIEEEASTASAFAYLFRGRLDRP